MSLQTAQAQYATLYETEDYSAKNSIAVSTLKSSIIQNDTEYTHHHGIL